MPTTNKAATKILARFKGLSERLEPGEEPLTSLPAIWDSARSTRGETCEVILTNQRLIGFYFRSFPREKLFFDAFQLSHITNVTLRQKSYEPVFRELMVAEGKRKVFIRAPRRKIEELYTILRAVPAFFPPERKEQADIETTEQDAPAEPATSTPSPITPTYERQEMRIPFERSPLAIMLLFTGGIFLEIIGILAWSATQSSSVGFPLCIAGFVAVCTAIFIQRQRRRQGET